MKYVFQILREMRIGFLHVTIISLIQMSFIVLVGRRQRLQRINLLLQTLPGIQLPTDLETTQFTDLSTDLDGTIVNWTWDFGDGNVSYEQNPNHSYADNGTYTVTLTVMDDDGAINTTSKQITVANVPPIANFTYTPLSPKTLEVIEFDDSSADLDGTIVNYTWDFGDGNISYEQNPTHIYADNGTYTVTLTVVDDDGATDTVSKNVTVQQLELSISILLQPGWNLITIPVQNNYTAKTLAENISDCIMISRFDAENQTYKSYIVGGPPGFDFSIQDGYGYFILTNQSSTLNLSGPPITNVSVSLEEGFNMIGWYHSYNTTASSLASNITNCTMVSKFDASNQTFKSYIVGGPPGFDFTITPGMGVFVLVDVASTWHGAG